MAGTSILQNRFTNVSIIYIIKKDISKNINAAFKHICKSK